MNNNDLEALLSTMDATEAAFVDSAAGAEKYVVLEVLRSADLAGFLHAYGRGTKANSSSFARYALDGVPRALSLFAADGFVGGGVAWAPPDAQYSTAMNAFLYRTGIASHVRRFAQFVRYGLAEFEVRADGTHRFNVLAQDIEAIDREAIKWYTGHLRRQTAPLLSAYQSENRKWVNAELAARVYSPPTFGIGYTSSRELEEYFEKFASLSAAGLPGHDALPLECRLGPLAYGQYREVVIASMARAQKHIAFVNTLARSDPNLDRRQVTTIFSEDAKIGGELADLFNHSEEETKAVLEAIGVSIGDIPELRKTFDCPRAILVRAGDGFWHQPVYGALSNPFTWLTRKLKRMYGSDWDRSVDLREDAFRGDLRSLFPEPRYYFHPRTPKLKGPNGIRTDVDALVIDRSVGTLAVVQLKWQDPFENSMAERASRSKNLAKEGNNWIQAVIEHCAGLDTKETARVLGIPDEEAARVNDVKLFILTRNGARFSGVQNQDRRAAWLSWFQLVRLAHNARHDKTPLARIWMKAREAVSPTQRAHDVSRFALDGLTVEVALVP